MKKEINLMLGDNMESLKKLADNSVDSIVTDPPYGLSFMNKKWDYEVPSIDFWKEALRVLKPGGHVLSFGGTRTYHRMVVNMEDAGFEIRDQIMWIYGSGFPKSLNIGKAYDKKEGNEREVTGENKNHRLNTDVENQIGLLGGHPHNGDGLVTKGTSQYEGWGTGLKPANEPICLARKPLSEKTIVDNVIKWGTGGINVDGCRIGTDDNLNRNDGSVDSNIYGGGNGFGGIHYENEGGRWPANILFDEDAAAELDKQSGISKSAGGEKKYELKTDTNIGGGNEYFHYDDKGGASRFFYVAKVSKKERNLGLDDSFDKKTKGYRPGEALGGQQIDVIKKNTHPTLKPINLMNYLIKLVTPEGGVILDPFMGSGSCGIAAALGNFSYIGMELDENYHQIAEQRIKEYKQYEKLLK
jgi:site-specific DNA-methyltransferase (adenine-specific)